MAPPSPLANRVAERRAGQCSQEAVEDVAVIAQRRSRQRKNCGPVRRQGRANRTVWVDRPICHDASVHEEVWLHTVTQRERGHLRRHI